MPEDKNLLRMNREDLRLLEDAISSCRLCPLWQARVHTVPGDSPVLNRLILRTALSTSLPAPENLFWP